MQTRFVRLMSMRTKTEWDKARTPASTPGSARAGLAATHVPEYTTDRENKPHNSANDTSHDGPDILVMRRI